MLLSIVILFCDNDYQFLDRAVSSIREHIKFDDYEIIAVDNREKEKSQIDIGDVAIVSKGYNLDAFEGRKFGAQASQGKFIWNFDVDDLMVGDLYQEDIVEDADVLQMYYVFNTGTRFDKKMFPISYGVNVWSRLYKADIVKKFYAKLERPLKFFVLEDMVLFDAVNREAKIWKYIPRVIYEYNFKNATFNKANKKGKTSDKEISDTYECHKYVYDIIGMPKKAEMLLTRMKEIGESGF